MLSRPCARVFGRYGAQSASSKALVFYRTSATTTRYARLSYHLNRPAPWREFSTRRPLASPNPAATDDASRPHGHGSIPIFHDVSSIRQQRSSLRQKQLSVGLVPTMGAFHDGHLRLIRQAVEENDQVFVSIFVNPTQFGVNEDLDSYPRTFESDLQHLAKLNETFESQKKRGRVTAIFAPSVNEMYPTMPPSSEVDGKGSFVTITPVGALLEGAARPVFFRGVATVCMKLFNIMTPDRVYFGQKDIQQTVIIKRLVTDFHLGIDVRIVPTVREDDGLAMSSRNVYLGARRRRFAMVLSTALKIAESQYLEQHILERDDILGPALAFVEQELGDQLEMPPEVRVLFDLDYISLADPDTMEEVEQVDEVRGAILSGALIMLPVEALEPGEDKGVADGAHRPVRLIDNIILPGVKK